MYTIPNWMRSSSTRDTFTLLVQLLADRFDSGLPAGFSRFNELIKRIVRGHSCLAERFLQGGDLAVEVFQNRMLSIINELANSLDVDFSAFLAL